MLSLLIKRMSSDGLSRKLYSWLADTVAITIALSMALLFPVNCFRGAGPYLLAGYDIEVNWLDNGSLDDVKGQSFFQSSFEVSNWFDCPISANGKTGKTFLNVCESYDNQDLYFYNDRSLVATIDDPEEYENGLSLDIDLARSLDVSPGDKVELSLLNNAISFVVVRVYESTVMGSGHISLVQWNQYFSESVDEDVFEADTAFIKASDYDAAISYFRNDYLGPDSEDMTRDELDEMRSGIGVGAGINPSRLLNLENVMSSLFNNVTFLTITSLLAMLVLALYLIRSAGQAFDRRRHDLSILRFIGMRRGTLFAFAAIDRAIFLIPSTFVAIVLTQVAVFPYLANIVYSWRVALVSGIVVGVFVVASILISALISVRKLERQGIRAMLEGE